MNTVPDVEAGPLLDRREAIRGVIALLGGMAFVGAEGVAGAVERTHAKVATTPGVRIDGFTAEQIALLDEIAETILPATRTPGAKAAKTGAFMALMVTDAYGAAERKTFMEGMADVDAAMRKAHQVSFMQASPAQRLALLTELDAQQMRVVNERAGAAQGRASAVRADKPYFRMMKELAMLGFFTSEVGYTQVLRYVETPGRYDPCVPYVAGEAAWALHA